MKTYDAHMTELSYLLNRDKKPDFSNFLKVLKREEPERPVLFELFLNDELYRRLAGAELKDAKDDLEYLTLVIKAFYNAGYDYASIHGSKMAFESKRHQPSGAKTLSLNQGSVITDFESFKEYRWPDPDAYDYSLVGKLGEVLPDGMKLMVMGPGGVLENVINLTGYEQLCFMVMDDPDLVEALFEQVGSRLVRYYENCSGYDTVGMVMSNDDWGFSGQTMLSTADMRKYVFPWHKKIAETIHKAGKPALLHSCGNLSSVMDDIIEDMRYDAKHSYEDNIMPVEDVYEQWGRRIAILGGMGMDFICRARPEEVFDRASAMLGRVSGRGGYALGSGNSIPYYVPHENYFAMLAAAH